MVNVGDSLNALSNSRDGVELRAIVDALVDEVIGLRASLAGITAQLDADAGVTDTDYAANHDPATITITK
ncbi:MAG: hypothetical protein GQ569_09260 [Methylococcaceae bacterium]|nr:hypothetical protein [Methylococcaceae bacterium]